MQQMHMGVTRRETPDTAERHLMWAKTDTKSNQS